MDDHELDQVLQNVDALDEFSAYSWVAATDDILLRAQPPPATCALPSMAPLPGDYHFEAQIHHEGPDCLFSAKLNKLFVNINKNVPVKFRLNPHVTDLYIRALPVYVSSNHQLIVVTRCITHVASDTQDGKDIDLVNHVVRCVSTNAAKYCEDIDSGRLSVTVPVEPLQSGMDYFTVSYQFTCLNSCSGISRRAMGIIFTLENKLGEVLGRQFMNVRVCSCPKRDKDKEEGKTNEEKILSTKKVLKREGTGTEPPRKMLKREPGTSVIVKIPVKVGHIKEIAQFAQDLIYRDIGKQKREETDQEKSLIALYQRIIETPEEDLLQGPVFSVYRE